LLLDREAPVLPRLLALIAVLYLLVPLDLMPDAIPLVGWLDDLGVIGLAAVYAGRQAARYRDDRALPLRGGQRPA
jgi:uncharacterized membrane protein YkvA (DUF1232 family)